MISRAELFIRIAKGRTKARARGMDKDLNYLSRLFSREVRYSARISNDMFCDQISFALNAVSVVSPALGYYLLSCVGYDDTRHILKSIRRHNRKN